MSAPENEVDRQMKATRNDIDENLGHLEERATSDTGRYGRIAAVVLGVVVVTGVGVLIYRRVNRRNRRQQLQSALIQSLKDIPDSLSDLPDSLRELADEVKARLKKPLPSLTVVVNDDGAAREPGTLESIVRRVAPAVVGTASSALVDRFTRPSGGDENPGRSTIPAYD